jgi:hypothetical protein
MNTPTTCRGRLCIVALASWLATSSAAAHELSTTRATLVLRDSSHLTVTLYVGLPELLFRTLADQASFGAFLVQYSAMDPTAFQREYLRAQSRIEQGTRVSLEGGRPLPLGRWSWPDPAAAQSMLRERVMRETVGNRDDAHEEPAAVYAEAVTPQGIRSIYVQFPEELQQVLIVSYRPTQTSVAAGARSRAIQF